MSSLLEDSVVGDKILALIGSASLDNHSFSYESGIQKQWVEINSVFLDCVGSLFGQSMKTSIEGDELVVTEIDDSVLPNFETEEAIKLHVAKLKCW